MRFEKWEALGNDFILIESSQAAGLDDALLGDDGSLDPAQVCAICDRHRGIGADGVLWIATSSGQSPRLIIANSDGSRPEMCGNGLRCVAGYCVRNQTPADGEVIVRTDAGARRCAVRRRAGEHFEVDVAMGIVHLGREFSFPLADRSCDFVTVDVGNPHAVTFDVYDEQLADQLGPAIDRAVNGGSNVELCRLASDGRRLDVIVWERGVGRTQACGTGASAAAVAAVGAGRAAAFVPVEVRLPGGSLYITANANDEGASYDVQLSGPARRVFAGQLDLPLSTES